MSCSGVSFDWRSGGDVDGADGDSADADSGPACAAQDCDESLPCGEGGCSLVVNESFEGLGHSEGTTAGNCEEGSWSVRGVGACAPDADAGAPPGAPAAWQAQSLKIDATSGCAEARDIYTFPYAQAPRTAYIRFELLVDEILPAGPNYLLFYTWGGIDSSCCGNTWDEGLAVWLVLRSDGPVLQFAYHYDQGSGTVGPFSALLPFNENDGGPGDPQFHAIEILWDRPGGQWAWRIDGVAQPNNVDSTDPVTANGVLTDGAGDPTDSVPPNICHLQLGASGADDKYRVFIDRFVVSEIGWPGP